MRPIRKDLVRLSETEWRNHYQLKHYSGQWQVLPLRSAKGYASDILISPTPQAEYSDTPFMDLLPSVKEILAHFSCEWMNVRLLRLSAGAQVHAHRDAELNYEKGEIRLHIPVITHPDVLFQLGGEDIHLEEGRCWYLNFSLLHSVTNNSPVDRIHLVMDARVNPWLKNLFETPGLRKAIIPEHDPGTRRQIIEQLRSLGTETANRMADEMEEGIDDESSPASAKTVNR